MESKKNIFIPVLTVAAVILLSCVLLLFSPVKSEQKSGVALTAENAQMLSGYALKPDGHRVLISGSGHERIAVVDYDGSTIWELKGKGNLWDEVNDAEMLADGKIVYAAHLYSGRSYVCLLEPNYITGDYEPLWEYNIPAGGENHTCNVTESGILLCETYSDYVKIVELDLDGNVIKTIGSSTNKIEGFGTAVGAHNQLRQITKTSHGTYLLTHFTNNYTYEIGVDGKAVNKYPFGKGFTAVEDKDGNIIISGGNQKAIMAYTRDGSELWKLNTTDVENLSFNFPAAVVPLDNGNILLADWGGHGGTNSTCVMEISPTQKKIVWNLNTDDSTNISNVFSLEGIAVDFTSSTSSYRSPESVVVCDATGMVYVADKTAKRILSYVGDTATPVGSIELTSEPNALLISPDGKRIYVACGSSSGTLIVIDTVTGSSLSTLELGHTPNSLTFGANEFEIFAANRFDGNVEKITLDEARINATAAKVGDRVMQEPMSLVYASGKLYVGSHLPNVAATEDIVASEIAIVDPVTLAVEKTFMLPNGSTDLKELALSPDGKYIYATHTIGRYWVPTTQLDRGWIYTNAITRLEVSSGEIATMLIDDLDMGAGNPWGIDVTDDSIVIGVAGTGEVIVIDTAKLDEKLTKVKNGTYVEDGSVASLDKLQNSLTFLTSVKTRIDLDEDGTRGVAVIGNKVYAANYFSGTVSVIDLDKLKLVNTSILTTTVKETAIRAGERLWNDANMAFGHWQSCASCHPDARADGLNWDNMNNGVGTPAQARSMMDSTVRGRVMATGIRANADVAVRAGVKYIMFNAGITETQYNQMYAYIDSLVPEESPWLENGKLSEAAQRGKELFDGKAGCITCHSGEIKGQDKLIYNFTQGDFDGRGLLVPPLREVWRTGPYLCDGSALTISDVLDAKIAAGNTELAALTESERADLEEYVLSIGSESAYDSVEDDVSSEIFADEITVRTGTVKGIRFTSSINKSLLNANIDGYRVIEYGTITIKSEYLGGLDLEMDKEYVYEGSVYKAEVGTAYVRGSKDVYLSETSTKKVFSAVLIGIENENLKADYTVRNYVKLENSNGNVITVYCNQREANMYNVAEEMYAKQGTNGYVYSSYVRKELFNNVLNIANSGKYNAFKE